MPTHKTKKLFWEDYIPSFSKRSLFRRLSKFNYETATFLYPDNILITIKSKMWKNSFIDFYSSDYALQRKRLCNMLLKIGGINKRAIIGTNEVKREEFLPTGRRLLAYWNGVNWIKNSNALTPPWLTAYAATQLDLKPGMKILELGFGYGYTSAVFSKSIQDKCQLFGVEIDKKTIAETKKIFEKIQIKNLNLKAGDGMLGFDENIKFDVIWSSLTAQEIPSLWNDQLKEDGRLGFFRPYTRDEFKQIKKIPFRSLEDNYVKYFKNWWEEVCLAIFVKKNGMLKEISKLYGLFNVPFVSPVTGTPKDSKWEVMFGNTEKTIENFARSNINVKK